MNKSKVHRKYDLCLYVLEPDRKNGEWDIQCFFCRTSLNSMPFGRRVTAYMDKSLNKHTELCAMRFLAGQIAGSDKKGHH